MTDNNNTDTPPTFDLTLPTHEPALVKDYYETCNFSEGSIALYTLVPSMTAARVQEIASIPQKQWADSEMPQQLLRPAKPTPLFPAKPLADVLRAHAALDIEVRPHADGGAADIGWQPHCFVVVTSDDLDDKHALLFVHADMDPEDEEEEEGEEGEEGEGKGQGADEKKVAPLEKFFFRVGEMYELLSGVILGSHGIETLKEWYDVDAQQEEAEE